MLTTCIALLAMLGPALSRASPVALPDDQSALEERQASLVTAAQNNYFPDCSDDPSLPDSNNQPKGPSQYVDGTGNFVKTSCSTGIRKSHCWTDFYVVNYQVQYAGWENSGQVIDCSTTSTCAEINVNLNSTCVTDSTTWDNTFGTSVQAQLPLWFKDASITTSLTYDHSFGGANDIQICTSTSNSGTCTWSDQKCHAIWTAQRNVQINGYLRRSCVAPQSGVQINNPVKRSDGFYTIGSMDINFSIPNNRIIGCSADCGDLNYPDPVPGNSSIIPITTASP